MAIAKGRRPSWADPKALRKAVDEYFEACEKKDVFPDYAGMLLNLQIDKDDVAAMTSKENPNAPLYGRIFSMAKLRRESWLARTMVSDGKRAAGCMNALKQGDNGDYNNTDKGEKTLKIIAEGISGGMSAFK